MTVLRRLIFALFKGLLALVLLVAIAIGIYVWRSQPQLGGTLSAPGLQQSVQVSRDGADVTHIQAASVQDASFAMGWVHAQERSWQLEFNRRVMHGQLSELFGPQTLQTDRLMRTLGIVQAAKAQWRNLPQALKAPLIAYADGINSFHANAGQALPPEFVLLRTRPGPWLPEDSMGWALMMALDLGGNWGNEFARLTAAQKLDIPALWQLFPPYPGEKPASTLNLAGLYQSLGVYRTTPPDATKTVADSDIDNTSRNPFGLRNGLPSLPSTHAITDWAENLGNVEGKGSNNWVVAGGRSQSGKPLLANDPHLALSAPAIWYFARLQASSGGPQGRALDVIGATLPGLPSVVLGRTAQVAWGFTNTGPDVQDLYLEQINPANPKQYKTPEGWAEFETQPETIKVKGQGDEQIIVRRSRHGPVLSDHQASHQALLDTSKYVLALRWSALDADNQTVQAGYNANFAQSVAELKTAFAQYHSPMQNVVMADTSGQVLFQTIGKVPLRGPKNDIQGVAPAPGWDARYDWAGWLPTAQNPGASHAIISKKGWYSSANQRIQGADFKPFIGQEWANPDRYDRIETLLAQTSAHSIGSMRQVQADTVSYAARRLLPALRASSSASSHTLSASVQALVKDFDGDMQASSAAPLVLSAWADELTRALIVPRLGADAFKRLYGKRHFRGLLESVMLASPPTGASASASASAEQGGARAEGKKQGAAATAGIEQGAETAPHFIGTPIGQRLNAAEAAAWCAPQSCDEQSSLALTRALDNLQRLYGPDVAQWRWGQAHRAVSSHKPFGNVPLLARFFDVVSAAGGDPWTVNVGQYWANIEAAPLATRHAASLRALYDLSDLENSQFIYQTGQSGLVWSPRYRDMAADWTAVQYRPLQLKPKLWAHQATLTP